MNTKLRKKRSFKTNNSNFQKTKKNVRNHRDIKLKANKAKKGLLSIRTKLSYNKFFSRRFIGHKNEKKQQQQQKTKNKKKKQKKQQQQIFMNKPVYVGSSMLELIKY